MISGRPQCPLCSLPGAAPVTGALYICRHCGIAYNSAYIQKSYNDRYFLDEYKNQYGKTYIEDRQSIRALSQSRLRTILRHFSGTGGLAKLSLLDIGSAAGFFLECARDAGIGAVMGVEISEYASRYCREELRIPVLNASFQDARFDGGYDIVTAWFFIEHCLDPVAVMQRIYGMLNPGGVFAFSCPSIFGPLFTLNLAEWARTHPEDHRVDFSPRGARALLRKCGFRSITVKPSGIHPERVISPRSVVYKPFSLLYTMFSRVTSFSDTIEVYAVK